MTSQRCRWLLVLVLGLLASSVKAQLLPQALTPEEVACNERQLELLLKRMRGGSEIFQSVQRTLAQGIGSSRVLKPSLRNDPVSPLGTGPLPSFPF